MKKKYTKIMLPLLIILSISFIASGSVIIFPPTPHTKITLSCGVKYLPFTIDPQDCWDSYSLDILIQVMETLFTYNYSDPTLPIIPLLAADFGRWDPSYTQYTIDLREGITFHDGSIFDADDVVFTFERQAWLYNFTGLNAGYVPDVYKLYVFPNGTRVIDNVIKIDADTIRFELNGVYGSFIDLLCYITSSILTDTYYNITGGIVDLNGDIIGTGPFKLVYYEENVEVYCQPYKNYWRGPAQIERLIFVEIHSATTRNMALLAGDIQFLKDPLPEWVDVLKFFPDITVVGKNSGSINFLGMNNILINRTWREAISYSFDYDYLINEIRYGHASRLDSPVGYGIKYYNGTYLKAVTNYTHARLVMQSMGFGTSFNVSEDSEWIATTFTSPFRSLNYSYDFDDNVQGAIFLMLINNLAKIGIKITNVNIALENLDLIFNELDGHTRNEVELYFFSYQPNYNDPNNYINQLFNNRTVAFNIAQYNGYTEAIAAGRDPLALNDNVQLLMEAAIQTPNGPARELMYDRIQELLIADFALCWVDVLNLIYAFYDRLTGFQQNLFNWVYFYPCQLNSGNHSRFEEKFPVQMIASSILLFIGGIVIGIVIHTWYKRRIE